MDYIRSVVNFNFLLNLSLVSPALKAHSRIVEIASSSNSAGTFGKQLVKKSNIN